MPVHYVCENHNSMYFLELKIVKTGQTESWEIKKTIGATRCKERRNTEF